MSDPISAASLAIIGVSAFILYSSVKLYLSTQFKDRARTKVSTLRKDYYSQKNRTPEKDRQFEKEIQVVEEKYKLCEVKNMTKKKEESLIFRGLKGLGKALKDSHDSYVLDGLIAEATSEDKTTRLRAIAQLKKDFPDVYKEIKSELKSK